ncbi:MAG: hypothetical protein ACYC26_07580 [Phycisphaerales bacterium]
MSVLRQALIGFSATICILLFASATLAQDESQSKAKQYFEDLIHYSRVARMDLAVSNGKALVDLKVEPAALLAAIEAGPYAQDYTKDLIRMEQMSDEVSQVAAAVERKIDDAKIAVIRNPERIRMELAKLSEGMRARGNAVRRLKEAGEYAVPAIIEVLTGVNDQSKSLQPYVLETMVEVGRPVVMPLSEALATLDPVNQQNVSRVLGSIGYAGALPYLQSLAEDPKTDKQTVDVVKLAIAKIIENKGVPANLSAAQLFGRLGEDYYAHQPSLILHPDTAYNLRWMVNDRGELTYQRIPTAIYCDVMAMQAARRALQRDNNLGEALSLWIAANFRRANNLPAGTVDPSYGKEMRSPLFYAVLAGPTRVGPVLRRALADHDANLALDAIKALSGTAGATTLADAAPMVEALNYPDRRVRYEAAFALASSKPTAEFEGSGRVVPVLAGAALQGQQPMAAVLCDDAKQLGNVTASVRAAGYQVAGGNTLASVVDGLSSGAAVDLLVIAADEAVVQQTMTGRTGNAQLAGAPMVVIAKPGQVASVTRLMNGQPATVVTDSTATDVLGNAIRQVADAVKSSDINAKDAHMYAATSVGLLYDLATAGNQLFDASLAQGALIEALGDKRQDVAIGAAAVLALIDSTEAQQAIAGVAMNNSVSSTLRIPMLKALATSARRFGNRVSPAQAELLLKLVNSAGGEMADAAGAAHGALNLPTSHSVEMIVQ